MEMKQFSDSLLWLWFPLGAFFIFTSAEFLLSSGHYAIFVGENGPLEFMQVFIMAIVIILAFKGLLKSIRTKETLLIVLYAVAAAGSIFVTGEEVSWGQHIFKWATPETWMAVNDQQETNLHNTTSWLDQKPRLLLEIGVIFGGIILPLISRYKAGLFPVWFRPLIPDLRFAVCALCFLFIKVFDKVGDFTEFVLYKRASEMTEMYIYYFIALYLFHLLQGQQKQAKAF